MASWRVEAGGRSLRIYVHLRTFRPRRPGSRPAASRLPVPEPRGSTTGRAGWLPVWWQRRGAVGGSVGGAEHPSGSMAPRRHREEDDAAAKEKREEARAFRRSLPSHLLWRSALGAPAARSGSSSRGVCLLDSPENHGGSLLQNIPTDRRMRHLPLSLKDAVINNTIFAIPAESGRSKRGAANHSNSQSIQLLQYPRIVGAAPPRSTAFHSGRAFMGIRDGISCMDLDRGNDDTLAGSPPRYLLVGSGGGECSIALYDLSYFGSDRHLYQQSSSEKGDNSQHAPRGKEKSHPSMFAHRPIARSLRHNSEASPEENAGGVPSGHRQPLLGVKWYPADVYGAFVSASISGEILVWDAQSFVPVFATYCHIYTGAAGMGGGGLARAEYEEGKSVAPLQCMDLPKTPEGCPHGTALLALGLGADGRGVVQLCDAFRGGSATHELVGHEGGVNAVAWDPHRPFRLVSGGDDCTVRIWDVRKAGAAACLGALNREGETNGGAASNGWASPPRKKQRVGLHYASASRMQGIESHGGPVTAVAFAPGGDDLVTSGTDGRIHHWDLRPSSSFVSPLAAIGWNAKYGVESGMGGMDPSVATGGRILPTVFGRSGGASQRASDHTTERHRSRRKATLAVIQPGSRSTATLVTTESSSRSARGKVTGYSLFGRRGKEPGGSPDFVLNGHLADVTSVVPIEGAWDNLQVGSGADTATRVNFLTAGKDGMVLSWGVPDGKNVVEDDGSLINDLSYLSQIRSAGRDYRVAHPSGAEPSFEDVDTW
ncbi:hypothetical protein ACHAXT_009665 [Thalassiosira profunda]